VLEQAFDTYIDDAREDADSIDHPIQVEREDDEDFVANLADNIAPLTELVTLPLTQGNKLKCPFHDDVEPSCAIYPDHFHCFGCAASCPLRRGGGVQSLGPPTEFASGPGPPR
jgi:hypothetical protein